LYAKAPTGADGEAQASLIAYLYITCVLRRASLLFAIWSAKGWGPLAFATMLQAAKPPPTLSGPDASSVITLERLSTLTSITRAEIAGVLAEAHGPWLLHLGPRERIAALEVLAVTYARLGHKRKEVYVLREVLGCLMDLIVVGREDPADRRASRTPRSAGLGFQNISIPGSASVGARSNEPTEGNESILRVAKYICRVHGIDLEAVKIIDPTKAPADDAVEEGPAMEDLEAETFGWPELQIGIVREALAIAEALPGPPWSRTFASHISPSRL
jgi:hypothetical protein